MQRTFIAYLIVSINIYAFSAIKNNAGKLVLKGAFCFILTSIAISIISASPPDDSSSNGWHFIPIISPMDPSSSSAMARRPILSISSLLNTSLAKGEAQ
jgi:hypothetical protein